MSVYSESESHPVVSVSLWPHWLYRPWNSPGQHTGVGSFSLLQEIFLTQRLTKVSCIASGSFTSWATKETPCIMYFVKATLQKYSYYVLIYLISFLIQVAHFVFMILVIMIFLNFFSNILKGVYQFYSSFQRFNFSFINFSLSYFYAINFWYYIYYFILST